MEQIEKVTKRKRSGYTLVLTSGRKLFVSEDVFVRYRLLKGKELEETLIKEIEETSALDQGYQLALNYLSYQLRSEKEIRKYLQEKEIPSFMIGPVIEKLREIRLVDDKVYAESYVRTMIRTSDKGPAVVMQQLRKKGIEEQTSAEALLLYTNESQQENATVLAKKLEKRYRQKSHQEKLNKMKQGLMLKGFKQEIIQAALASVSVEKDSQQETELLEQLGDKLWERNVRLEFPKRKQKVIRSLFQKGFDYELIQQFIEKKELEHEG